MSANPSQPVEQQALTLSHAYHFTGNDYTVERKRDFIDGLVQTHTVYRAATIAGISKKTAYNWYVNDEQFAEAWEEALQSATEDLETCMFERAKEKDTLAGIFLLKKYNPEFRDRVQVDLGSVQQQIDEMISRLDAAQRQQLTAVTTEFIETGYNDGEYRVVEEEGPTQAIASPVSPTQKDVSTPD